jgi:ribosome modulation factor
MKRQKRDKLGRAHSNGYQAGLLAEPRSIVHTRYQR